MRERIASICWQSILPGLLLSVSASLAQAGEITARWSETKANAWYAEQKWIIGSNYLPANAINQLEMWQAETFDPQRIDLELGWAQNLGMTTMRVFLHSLLWRQDVQGFEQRVAQFLAIADKHGIKPIFVLFDACWDPKPKLGLQHAPVRGVHNSGWVQDPGAALTDPDALVQMESYVKGIVGAFADDKRILAWDVWNEPDNPGGGNYAAYEVEAKAKLVAKLLPQVFAWARSVKPVQPLTSPLWRADGEKRTNDWSAVSTLNSVERAQIEQSDVVSFHSYEWPELFQLRVTQLATYHRPVICTEYLARGIGSTIDNVLPLAKKLNVGAVNWGFVDGKEQTRFPWDSWDHPYVSAEPLVWHHDLLHVDGTPYRRHEVDIISALTHSPRGEVPTDPLSVGNSKQK